jgi:hypothetical protein
LLPALERAHRGLFRAEGGTLVDVWSGAEFVPGVFDEAEQAELAAGTGQLMDARVVGAGDTAGVTLMPGAVFHPRDAAAAIEAVLAEARARSLPTDDTLDALLRMERTLRSLSRVRTAYAYRPEALAPRPASVPPRRSAKNLPR